MFARNDLLSEVRHEQMGQSQGYQTAQCKIENTGGPRLPNQRP